jgi:hypothetical protein
MVLYGLTVVFVVLGMGFRFPAIAQRGGPVGFRIGSAAVWSTSPGIEGEHQMFEC